MGTRGSASLKNGKSGVYRAPVGVFPRTRYCTPWGYFARDITLYAYIARDKTPIEVRDTKLILNLERSLADTDELYCIQSPLWDIAFV